MIAHNNNSNNILQYNDIDNAKMIVAFNTFIMTSVDSFFDMFART